MSDETIPSSTSGPSPDAINEQVRDALRQVDGMLGGQAAPFTAAVTFQALAQAVALGMQNAVAQQQHSHMLRSALTTAAARALLDGKREEAEAVLKLAESRLVNPDVGEEILRLQGALGKALEQLRDILAPSSLADLKNTVSAFTDPAPSPVVA
jgi:D-arabinose 1-dehydrogenase-like Zn-dependent alcohol dehydrogenase